LEAKPFADESHIVWLLVLC